MPESATADQSISAITLDEIEGGFKRIRPALGITAFGINARVFEPGVMSKPHWHETQEEVFFVHRGTMEASTNGTDWTTLPEGSVVRVPPRTAHAIRNPTEAQATVLLMGGHEGIVEGDAAFVEDVDELPWRAR